MAYAFLIDNRSCIGCHACSVACKTEHEVPLGVARTWVKYVERGEFPDTRRTFTVNRCNHCDDAPCVEICPTTALFKRPDGIVDFDSDQCIGCKGCMQACPYDAIYIDPQTETAAKCNFCAHRVEVGLEPPCVTVCPTQAIVAGDLSDPTTKIAQLMGRHPVQVRKPEKGTKPRVFYLEADAASLVPSAAPPPNEYMWADAPQAATLPAMPQTDDAGAPRRSYGVKEQHRNSWGFRVSLYLWTKSLAAGALIVPALASMTQGRPSVSTAALFFALLGLGLTGALLVSDLRQPQRFLWTLIRPQWRSWLVRGAYIITAYAGAVTTLLVARIVDVRLPSAVLLVSVLLAVATAVYTAFLFGQAKGRDLWQSPLLAPHLLVQAIVAGAALFQPRWLLFALPLNGLLIAAEVWGYHASEDARRAAALIGGHRLFTSGVLLFGHVVPLMILWFVPGLLPLASCLALVGLLIFEHLYVDCPQRIPLS